MQDRFYKEGLFEDVDSFYTLHDSVFALVRQVSIQEEIYKDMFSGYMKAKDLNVDCGIIGQLRNRP